MKIQIHTTCIWCGACAGVAWDFFKVEGVPALVIKQPTNADEEKKCEEAQSACPMGAIELIK